jgi:hypothetical protein
VQDSDNFNRLPGVRAFATGGLQPFRAMPVHLVSPDEAGGHVRSIASVYRAA